ncbi:hypothetical protein KCP78_13645 [Salmonella enterica subsp. enterica]|nr:hypothetical protein KCP78_13645 [Salmonella enterica subsp. enterica]
MVRPLLSAPSGVPEVIVPTAPSRWALPQARITVNPNPHARLSAENALIYVDNIRDAPVKYDPIMRAASMLKR